MNKLFDNIDELELLRFINKSQLLNLCTQRAYTQDSNALAGFDVTTHAYFT